MDYSSFFNNASNPSQPIGNLLSWILSRGLGWLILGLIAGVIIGATIKLIVWRLLLCIPWIRALANSIYERISSRY